MIFEKEQHQYNDKAKDYIGNQQKTEGLLNRALKMAKNKKGTFRRRMGKTAIIF